jgi:transcriptional regulator with XRE-family HTH domain
VPAKPTLTLRLDNLDKIRTEAGITTYQQLAARMRYDQGQLSRVLAGKAKPGMGLAAGLLFVFGMDRFPELFKLIVEDK